MDDLGAFFEMHAAAGMADDAVQLGLAAPVITCPPARRKPRLVAIAPAVPAALLRWAHPPRTGPPVFANT